MDFLSAVLGDTALTGRSQKPTPKTTLKMNGFVAQSTGSTDRDGRGEPYLEEIPEGSDIVPSTRWSGSWEQ